MRLKWNKGGFFFRVPDHETFEYKARYYDPDKESRQSRRERLKFSQNPGVENPRANNLAGKLRRNRVAGYSTRARNQNQRTFLLAGMMFLLLFYYLDQISIIFALPVLFILMLVFIHKAKKG